MHLEYWREKIINIKKQNFKLASIFIAFSSLVIIFFSNTRLENYQDMENWPVIGYYDITSEYGERISPITGFTSFHNGIDIGAPEGSKLVAILDSEVKFVDFTDGYGCTIKLEGMYGEDVIEFVYSHVSPDYIVTKGMTVQRGDIIGFGGPKYINLNGSIILNGNTTGPHLHFEVKKNYININPIEFLNSL